MISLARHIELLLLENDCVIIPGIGGFIASHAEAYFTGEEHLFLPPYRTIAFNQQLQVNDGLLVQSYMAAYDASYPSANLQMEKDLEKMMNELDLKGEFVLENIGTLKKGINENIAFIPHDASMLTPSLYGLYSYEIKSLSRVTKEREIQESLQAAATMHVATADHIKQKEAHKTHSKEFIIRLNRHWLDFGISAAAAIVLFFCISYPTLKTAHNDSDTVVASFTPVKDLVAKPTPTVPSTIVEKTEVDQATPKNEAKTVGEKMTVADSSTPKDVTEALSSNSDKSIEKPEANTVQVHHPIKATTEQKTGTSRNGKYVIVLASYVSQKNADIFIQRLNNEGLKEARYIKNGKISRILYSDYADEAQAQNALNSLRQQNSAFAEAWILEQ